MVDGSIDGEDITTWAGDFTMIATEECFCYWAQTGLSGETEGIPQSSFTGIETMDMAIRTTMTILMDTGEETTVGIIAGTAVMLTRDHGIVRTEDLV